MISDSLTNLSPTSAPTSRDLAKKKRTTRSTKLKQCKLDVRREQWLSQVKNKGCRGRGETNVDWDSLRGKRNEMVNSMENIETRGRGEENNGSIHHESDTESPFNSSISSILGGTDSGTNYTGSSSSSSSGCFYGSISDEEENVSDGCLDSWEALADALASDDEHEKENPYSESGRGGKQIVQSNLHQGSTEGSDSGAMTQKPACPRMKAGMQGAGRAWRPDDVLRPHFLPSLSKQHSFPTTDRRFGNGGIPWACNGGMTVPSSCPICYEELDLTDTSFLPCACGFRLCLFCHNRILEEDGRCPGCRKPYEQDHLEMESSVNGSNPAFRLGRSCSMVAKS